MAKMQHQAFTNIHKTLNWATAPFQKIPETSHIFKPLLNAVLYFRNLKNNATFYRKVRFRLSIVTQTWSVAQSLVFRNVFSTKVFRQSSVQNSVITQKFSASFLKIIKRKNRSEAFCVSSENILHLTFCGLKMWRKCNTKPLQIYTKL